MSHKSIPTWGPYSTDSVCRQWWHSCRLQTNIRNVCVCRTIPAWSKSSIMSTGSRTMILHCLAFICILFGLQVYWWRRCGGGGRYWFVFVLHHSNSISVISWRSYDVWEGESPNLHIYQLKGSLTAQWETIELGPDGFEPWSSQTNGSVSGWCDWMGYQLIVLAGWYHCGREL